jgi:outer membrane protein
MNRSLKSVITAIAFGSAALGLSAQPVLKIATADMSKLLEGYYKTDEQMVKIRADEQKAQTELERMSKELTQVVDQYKEALDQSKNTLLTAEARAKAESDVAQKAEDIRRRQTDGQAFGANAQRSLQQRISNARSLLLDEISKKVIEIAKNKGATLVVDRSGPTFIGIPSVIYADPAFDITAEALTEINKDRPVAAAAAPASPTPAATPAAPAVDTPAVTVPGLTPKK